jgi:hypothetical protein
MFTNLDTGEELHPPYPVDESGVRFSAGGVYSDQARFGSQDPVSHWTAGRLRSLSFNTVLFSEHKDDEIEDALDVFVKLAEKDENLGRPPICEFVYGSVLDEMVQVELVEVEIGQLKSGESAGAARRVGLTFTLRRYKPFSQIQIDPTKPKKESYFLIVSRAEASYEAIARRYYGDPLRGDRLRKRHPEMPFCPTVGSKISVPARSTILKETVEPAFHALSLTNDEAIAAFERVLEARANRKAFL